MSGFSITITPKRSDSKILLLAFLDLGVGSSTDNTNFACNVRTKWTDNANGAPSDAYTIPRAGFTSATHTGGGGFAFGGTIVAAIDAPGSTSAKTFKLRSWMNTTSPNLATYINMNMGGLDGRSLLMAIELASLT